MPKPLVFKDRGIKYDDLMSRVQIPVSESQETASNIYEDVSAADSPNCERFLLGLFNNGIWQVG